MESKTLTDNIIGCQNCHGEWIKAKKVKKFIEKLKETEWEGQEINEVIDKHAGEYFK